MTVFVIQKYLAAISAAINTVASQLQILELGRDKYTEELSIDFFKEKLSPILSSYVGNIDFGRGVSSGIFAMFLDRIGDIGGDRIVKMVMEAF